MHHLSRLLLGAVVSITLLATGTSARALEASGFTYEIVGGAASVTGCTSGACPTNLVIPDTLNGNAVTSIRSLAFDEVGLTSVTIPNSVTSIGYRAFYHNQLTSVSLGNSVTSIGDWAFHFNLLTSLTIPNSVTSIGEGAFGVNLLTSLTIPNSVTSIRYAAFYNNRLTSLTIPNSVTSIGEGAFCVNLLTSLTIPNSVTSIRYAAFAGNRLTSLTIPDSVTSIGDKAFMDNSLTTVTFLGNAPTAGFGVFRGNANLHELIRPVDASGWGLSWNGLPAGASLTGLFTALTNGSDGTTVTYTPVGTTITLSTTGQAGDGEISYSESDDECSISGSTLTVNQYIDGSCIVTATISQSANYLAATDTVTVTIVRASERATATVKPTVTGTFRVGQTLTASKGTWVGYPTPTFTYQWYVCHIAIISVRTNVLSGWCGKIPGATRSTYKLTSAQRGKYVTVLVTGRSAGTTATSWLAKSISRVK